MNPAWGLPMIPPPRAARMPTPGCASLNLDPGWESCMRRGEYKRLEQSLDELGAQLAQSDISDELVAVLLVEIEKTKEKLRLLPRRSAGAGGAATRSKKR
jgi:hypothetical protein